MRIWVGGVGGGGGGGGTYFSITTFMKRFQFCILTTHTDQCVWHFGNLWVAEDQNRLQADSENSEQSARLPSLV